MSVIRQPELLGRTARRRLLGMTASVTAALLEAIAVCTWFFLVAFRPRTLPTALFGLAILLCGCLLRADVFGATIGDRDDAIRPCRIAIAVFLASGWILWLLVAEWIGGAAGVLVAAAVLTAVLVVQFTFERLFFGVRHPYDELLACLVSAALLAVGASALLASAWFSDWSITSPLALEATTLAVRFEATHLGAIVLGLFAFLAHQHRFQRRLDP